MERKDAKPLEWVGSSKSDLKSFPDEVQDEIGFVLHQAQIGSKHRDAKLIAHPGTGVLEAISRFDKNTYRAVYTMRFREAVYVLHAFQKKSKRGIATPKTELDLVRRRLLAAERHYRDAHADTENE
jgi:phage-related protein